MEENFIFDTLKRIGSTCREQLAWLVGRIEGPALGTDEWRHLLNELRIFAMSSAGAPSSGLEVWPIDLKELPREIVVSSKTLRAALQKAQYGILYAVLDVLERVARRQRVMLRQHWVAGWDQKRKRYLLGVAPEKDTFRDAVLRGVTRCVLEHGHLLKECQASAKLKPGRKRKDEPKPMQAVCGKLFVARKQTQLYCSGACLSRTLTRKKRARKIGRTRRAMVHTKRRSRAGATR